MNRKRKRAKPKRKKKQNHIHLDAVRQTLYQTRIQIDNTPLLYIYHRNDDDVGDGKITLEQK